MAKIEISGPIYATDYTNQGMCSSFAVAAEIRAASGELELAINSPGGELGGLAEIVAALHDWRAANPAAKCTATVTALAASAAAYLLLMLPRGARVRAYPMAMLMYHSSSTLACGGSGAMRDAAHYLEQLDTVLRSYLERTAVPAPSSTSGSPRGGRDGSARPRRWATESLTRSWRARRNSRPCPRTTASGPWRFFILIT